MLRRSHYTQLHTKRRRPMNKYKFTFVLGAGASQEVGLPVGTTLRDQIASLLNITFDLGRQKTGDPVVMAAIRERTQLPDAIERDANAYVHACRKIRDALPQSISIDNLIDTHRGNSLIEICGKLGIARAILRAERQSSLYFDPLTKPGPDLTRVAKAWLTPFFQLLTENCPLSTLPDRLRSTAFVVFNYDRCLEQFLIYSLQNVYEVNEQQALELIRQLTILRPYGSVGALRSLGPGQSIPFGGEPNANQLLELALGVKTFTEGVDPAKSDIQAIREAVTATQKLVFLGFAFHPSNVDLLFPSDTPAKSGLPTRAFFTDKGLSAPATNDICSELARRVTSNIDHGLQTSCFDLFSEYWRQLSMTRT